MTFYFSGPVNNLKSDSVSLYAGTTKIGSNASLQTVSTTAAKIRFTNLNQNLLVDTNTTLTLKASFNTVSTNGASNNTFNQFGIYVNT
jgi:hypothetical protein